jgi:predicted MFS family arabinose efflux permease
VAGITSVVAQVVVPMASALSAEEERGRVVGVVMSGLLIGILLARTVSGLVAEAGSWRVMFWVAAVIMLVLAAALARALPAGRGPATLPYRSLLASVGRLVRTEPALRRRMFYGACGMAGFSVLWTALALLLSASPFHYSEATIGLFGLAGVAGAAAAQAAGRLADAGHARQATGGFLLAIAAGWGALALGSRSVAPILIGIVVLDLGVQGQHILNQSTIFGLRPDTESRVNTAYMTSNFIWGAIGSASAAAAWSAGGWHAVCAIGGGAALIALAGWVHELRGARRLEPVGDTA